VLFIKPGWIVYLLPSAIGWSGKFAPKKDGYASSAPRVSCPVTLLPKSFCVVALGRRVPRVVNFDNRIRHHC
jgi:hypothetical protein